MRGTIKSSDEINRMFSEGRRFNTASMLAIVKKRRIDDNEQTNTPNGRIAIIAGKRMGNAPRRNKAKRRMREAARQAQAPWEGFDVVLVAREAIVDVEFSKIVKDMETIAANIARTTGSGVKR